MDKVVTEQALRVLYQARQQEKIDEALAYFAENAVFRIAMSGGPDADSDREHRPALRDVLLQLFEAWNWIEISDWKVILSDNEAAVRYTLDVEYTPNRNRTTIEVFDHLTFDDNGLIVEFVEFLDTAELARVTA